MRPGLPAIAGALVLLGILLFAQLHDLREIRRLLEDTTMRHERALQLEAKVEAWQQVVDGMAARLGESDETVKEHRRRIDDVERQIDDLRGGRVPRADKHEGET